jgi:hypothetical protein
MLEAMDIAVGVLLAVAGLVLVGLIAAFVAHRRAEPPAVEPPAEPVDDLPYFLEFPPGSTPAAPRASDSVVALAPAPRPAAPAPAPPPRRSIPIAAMAVLAGLLVLLLVAAAVVAATAGPDRRGAGDRQAVDTPTAEARVRFGGIVLEERAVGVTVSHPELFLDARADGSRASLELPTWNCFATEAPEDPVAAGCVPGRTEYAELDSPDLSVTTDGGGLRIEGDFATSTRPTGSDPEPTGRSYALVVTVEPDGSGALELGQRRTEVVEGEVRIHD